MRPNLRWVVPLLAALAAVAACAPTPGASGPEDGVEAVGGVDGGNGPDGDNGTGGENGTGGGTGGGAPPDSGPWPIVVSAGTVELAKGKYCGGSSPAMQGRATVSVANGPVTVTFVWRRADDGHVYGESTVEFTGTGAQSKEISTAWDGWWGASGTVRLSYADLVPGPGAQASQYIPPSPLDIDYQVPQCTKPDLSVKILGVNTVPQNCPLGRATAVAQVTLADELSSDTGGFGASLVWSHPVNASTQVMNLTFTPDGPKVLTFPVTWSALPAPRNYVAKAHVEVERPTDPDHPHRYVAPEFPFATRCN